MPHQVFICHSTKDKLVADASCAALEAGRISCWIAPRDINPGVEWGEAIVNAILECEVVLLIFSNNANNSPDVRREINLAIGEQKVLVPFRIEDVMPTGSIKYAVSNRHWLDAIDPPMEGRLVELREKIALLINRPPDVEELWKPQPEPPAPPAGPSEAELVAKAEAFRQEEAAREAEALRQQQARLAQEAEARREAEDASLKAEEERRAQAAAAEHARLKAAEELRTRQFAAVPPPTPRPLVSPAPLQAPVSIAQPKIESNMALAILATIFCCLPIGIFSIVKANKVNKLLEAHDYEAARKAAKENLRLIIITVIAGIVFYGIALANKS